MNKDSNLVNTNSPEDILTVTNYLRAGINILSSVLADEHLKKLINKFGREKLTEVFSSLEGLAIIMRQLNDVRDELSPDSSDTAESIILGFNEETQKYYVENRS